jgi:hypothetical protein
VGLPNLMWLFQGLLSDGLLAWRAFVIFGRMTWMKWFLIVVISTNFGTLPYKRMLAALLIVDGLKSPWKSRKYRLYI